MVAVIVIGVERHTRKYYEQKERMIGKWGIHELVGKTEHEARHSRSSTEDVDIMQNLLSNVT